MFRTCASILQYTTHVQNKTKQIKKEKKISLFMSTRSIGENEHDKEKEQESTKPHSATCNDDTETQHQLLRRHQRNEQKMQEANERTRIEKEEREFRRKLHVLQRTEHNAKNKIVLVDSASDTSDLESFASQMDVYIPLHISGDGISRALTTTDSDSHHHHHNSRNRMIGKQPTTVPTTTATAATAAAIATSDDDHLHSHEQSRRQSAISQHFNKSTATTTSVTAHSNFGGVAAASASQHFPENFPIPATCSLAEIRAMLERLLKSKVFLGFIDNRTGGLIELRQSTLEQFNLIPDQKKAIHCRKLKKEKTRSELLLEASAKKHHHHQHHYHLQSQRSEGFVVEDGEGEDPNLEMEKGEKSHDSNNSKNTVGVSVPVDPWERRKEEIELRAKRREIVQQQKELVERLADDDLKRREIRRKKIEEQMYPTEGCASLSSGAPLSDLKQKRPASAGVNGTNSPNKKKVVMTRQDIADALERLTNVDAYRRRKEEKTEAIRQRMVTDGYIVEPSQFAKVSYEKEEERNERFYGRGVQWLRKHSEKVASEQQKQKERKVPKLKSKEEWDEWLAKRSKPLEKEKIAAENKPILVPIGSGGSGLPFTSRTPDV